MHTDVFHLYLFFVFDYIKDFKVLPLHWAFVKIRHIARGWSLQTSFCNPFQYFWTSKYIYLQTDTDYLLKISLKVKHTSIIDLDQVLKTFNATFVGGKK